MPSAADEIRARINAFTADLTALVRSAAMEAVQASLGSTAPASPAPAISAPAAPRRSGRRPTRKTAAARAPAPARPRGRKPAGRKRAPGQKRAPGEIQALIDKLAAYVKGHPGATMGTIKEALSVPRNDLVVPSKKLIAAGRIRAEGKKQFTKYFPL